MLSISAAHMGENEENSSTSIVEMENSRFILKPNITLDAA
jgi:hypothetical protein